jgi:S1-C subfamily serine protease
MSTRRNMRFLELQIVVAAVVLLASGCASSLRCPEGTRPDSLTKGHSAECVPAEFEDISDRLDSATVLVGICDIGAVKPGSISNIKTLGSGFFINSSGLMLTARHVLPLPLPANKAIFIFRKEPEDKGLWAYSYEIDYDFPDIDVVGVRFHKNIGKKMSWLPVSPELPRQGEEIGIFGYPASRYKILPGGDFDGNSITPRVAKATISNFGVRSIEFSPDVRFEAKNFIESQFTFVKGNSGGPIVSAKSGKVLGIVTGVMSLPQTLQDLSFPGSNPIVGVPYATYAYAISINEVLPRLKSSDYSSSWAW